MSVTVHAIARCISSIERNLKTHISTSACMRRLHFTDPQNPVPTNANEASCRPENSEGRMRKGGNQPLAFTSPSLTGIGAPSHDGNPQLPGGTRHRLTDPSLHQSREAQG